MEQSRRDVLLKEVLELIPTELIIKMAEYTEQSGRFGIFLTSGKIFAAQNLKSLHKAANGDIWIEVKLHEPPKTIGAVRKGITTAQTPELTASINTSNIEAIMELAN